MKVRVGHEKLSKAVAWVSRALPARPVVPVLAGMVLRAGDGELALSCFDYEVSGRAQVSAEVGEPGSALVPGTLLAEITKNLPPADVEITTLPGLVVLTCGSAEFALVSLSLSQYPALPELPAVAGTVDGGLLSAAAAQVLPAASREDASPMLTGVYLTSEGGELTLVGSDRHRMAVRTVAWTPAGPAAPQLSALVPARTLAAASRIAGAGTPVTIAAGSKAASGAAAASRSTATSGGAAASGGAASSGAAASGEMAASGGAGGPGGAPHGGVPRPYDGLISFEGGGRRLSARLMAGEYYRYEKRFETSFDACAELPAGLFTEAVRRVALVAERGTPVQLAFRGGTAVVQAQTDGRARAVESVPAVVTGAGSGISASAQQLLDGLGAALLTPPGGGGEAGRIRLRFSTPARPALITWLPPAQDAATENGPADAADAGGEQAEPDGTPDFRYLVVALRAGAPF